MSSSWPPRTGSRIRSAAGEVLEVTAYHHNLELGEFVVVKRTFEGGWECHPVTRGEWFRLGFRVTG